MPVRRSLVKPETTLYICIPVIAVGLTVSLAMTVKSGQELGGRIDTCEKRVAKIEDSQVIEKPAKIPSVETPTIVQPVSAIVKPATPNPTPVVDKTSEKEVLLAALNILINRAGRDGNSNYAISSIMNIVKDLDQDVYYQEMLRIAGILERPDQILDWIANSRNGERAMDKKMIPIIKAIQERSVPDGNSSYRWRWAANGLATMNTEETHALLVKIVKTILSDENSSSNMDSSLSSSFLRSGLPSAHVALLRGLRQGHQNHTARQKVYENLEELYAGHIRFPAGELIPTGADDRNGSNSYGNMPEDKKGMVLAVEKWIIANKADLTYNRENKAMLLKGKAKSDPIEKLDAIATPAKPGKTDKPSPVEK